MTGRQSASEIRWMTRLRTSGVSKPGHDEVRQVSGFQDTPEGGYNDSGIRSHQPDPIPGGQQRERWDQKFLCPVGRAGMARP